MIKRRLLSYDIPQLTKVFKKDFPQLVTMAEESESAALFKEALRSFCFFPHRQDGWREQYGKCRGEAYSSVDRT